jgi:hypothetical protein
MSKSGDNKRDERLKAALRDNLKRRKAQLKARSQGAKDRAKGLAKEHDSAGIGGEIALEIADAKPKG